MAVLNTKDMYLNIYLTVTIQQVAILDVKQIRVSYLRSWFLLDVIAAFPIGYILFFAVSLDSNCIRLGWRHSIRMQKQCM